MNDLKFLYTFSAVSTVDQQSMVVFIFKIPWLRRLANSTLFFVPSDCILQLSIYFPCLEGLNNCFFFVQLSRLLFPVLRLFVDGSLNAVKLRIYGSSVIKTIYILREPRFPDKCVNVIKFNNKFYLVWWT